MGVRYCEFFKKDGTKCKNFAQPEQKYCHVHLKTIVLQDSMGHAATLSKLDTHKFDLFFSIFSLVVFSGIFLWVVQDLWSQLRYIESYYIFGFNDVAVWLYRIILVFKYVSAILFFILWLGGFFSSDEVKAKNLIKAAFVCALLFAPLTGAQNLAYYSVVGWHTLTKSQIFEGFEVLVLFFSLVTIFLATKNRGRRITRFLSFIFDLLITLGPLLLIFALSAGDSSLFTGTRFVLVDAGVAVLALFLFSLGLDDLKGKPSLLSRFVIWLFGAVSGEVSLQILQSNKAEALQAALQNFRRLSPLQQEQLSEWIISNFKPSAIQKIWGIVKLVVATFVLTIVAQEPAVAFLKWLLKYFFDINY